MWYGLVCHMLRNWLNTNMKARLNVTFKAIYSYYQVYKTVSYREIKSFYWSYIRRITLMTGLLSLMQQDSWHWVILSPWQWHQMTVVCVVWNRQLEATIRFHTISHDLYIRLCCALVCLIYTISSWVVYDILIHIRYACNRVMELPQCQWR